MYHQTMSRISKVIDHPEREQIEQDIIKGRSNSYIAKHYSNGLYQLSRESIRRYREELIKRATLSTHSDLLDSLIDHIRQAIEELEALMRAALDELKDEEGNMHYTPIADDIKVSYLSREQPEEKPVKRYASLQQLLDLLQHDEEIKPVMIRVTKYKHPADVAMNCANTLTSYLSTLLKAQTYNLTRGEADAHNGTLNASFYEMVNAINTILEDYPEARKKLSEGLEQLADEEDEREAL